MKQNRLEGARCVLQKIQRPPTLPIERLRVVDVAIDLATRIDRQICFVGLQFAFRRHPQADEEATELPRVGIHPRETSDKDGLPAPVKDKRAYGA